MPVDQSSTPGYFPAGIARAVAGDALHRRDQFMVMDAAIVRAGNGAQFGPAIFGLQRLHLFGAVRGQAVLQVDPGQRRGKLAQIGRRGADQTSELAEAPMGGRHRPVRAGHHQGETFGVVAARFHPDGRALDRPRPAALGAAVDGGEQVRQREIALIGRAGKPLRGHAADAFPPAHIHPVAASALARGVQNLHLGHGTSP